MEEVKRSRASPQANGGTLRQRHAGTNGVPKPTMQSKSAHPAGDVKHGGPMQLLRAIGFVFYFLGGMICIHITQFLGAPLYLYNKDWYYAWMAVTKAHFGLLVTTMTQWWSPTVVRVSWDHSVKGQLWQTEDGRLECDFPERMIMIANHQIYTDWLYLWWIAYTSHMHGHIYIILKQSLKWVPILGPGMQFFSFVFMSRKWANDKPRMQYRLQKLASYRSGPVPGERVGAGKGQLNPMWLLIYPEGTNMSKNARATSKRWSEKTGLRDLDHALLPRSTGLKLCLDELGDSIEWVYDCTVAYEGIPRGEYGQDVFTLKATYFEGRPPPSVNMYWRRFPRSSIPVADEKEFGDWLLARWREKDQLLEIFQQTGRFPASDSADAVNGTVVGKKPHGQEWIETTVRPKNTMEVVQIFAPAAILLLLGNIATKFWRLLVYGSLKGAKKIPTQRVKATW